MRTKTLRRFCIPILAIAAALVLLAISSGDTKATWVPGTPQFDPIFDVKLCNDLKATFKGPTSLKGSGGACAPNMAPGGNPDITIPFLIPTGHINYDQSVWLSAGGASETRASGTTIPDGAPAGGLESRTTLGLAANPCSNTIYPDFIWWDAVTDPAVSVACAQEGTSNRWLNLATDDIPDGAGPNDDFAGQADPDSPIVTAFPTCSAAAFDPDGDGIDTDGNPSTIHDQPVQPNWRGAGLTQVPPGGDWQMLQNFEFDPGDLQAAFSANAGTRDHAFAKLPAGLGYVNVIILNDPTTVILQPNPISDFCSILGTRGMIKGSIDTNGDGTEDTPRITQPAAAGSYLVEARTRGYRDTDGDGLENGFDTCVWTANSDNPYNSSGADTDMLDPVCDPTPAAKIDDQDGDGYLNSQDYCPLIANPLPGGEKDSENSVPYNTATGVLPGGKSDGGPQQDQIGDDCDTGVLTWRDVFTNNTGVTVDDLHLTFETTKTIYTVLSITGGAGPDTWDWQINAHPLNTNAADCGTHTADTAVQITGTGGTAVPPGGILTVIVQPCFQETSLSVTAQWTSSGVPVGSPFVVVNTPESSASPTLADGDYFNVIYVDSVCVGGTDNDQDGWCADGNQSPGTLGDDNNDTNSYNPAGTEDGVAGTCADGLDNGEAPGGQDPDGLVDRWDPDCNPNVKDTGGTYSNLMPDATDPDQDDDSYDADNTEDGDDLEDQGAPGSNQCGDTVDNDADTKTDSADPDCRNSVYTLATSNEDWCVGTDPLNDCPLIIGHDTWPPDFNTDGVSNILDIVQLTPPVFNSAPYPHPNWQNYVTRKDLNCDGTINILDIVQLTPPVFNKPCTE